MHDYNMRLNRGDFIVTDDLLSNGTILPRVESSTESVLLLLRAALSLYM